MMRVLLVLVVAAVLSVPFAVLGIQDAFNEREPEAATFSSIELPVACTIGLDCFIQNFFDHDPGPGRMDYACGRLSYDGHDGTDIRVPNEPAMMAGVDVIAAASGIVKAVRDGMTDIDVNELPPDAVRGREAGNGVVIDHGGGWETQYSHLKQGSIAVEPGAQVTAGQKLGQIGLSGNTEFPHVEFSVRHNGQPLDPFVGLASFRACGDLREPLWSEAALTHLDYQSTGLLTAGFATERVDSTLARRGAFAADAFERDVPALVFWVDIFGALAGDQQQFRITAPDGAVIHEQGDTLQDSNVSWFAFSGLRAPPGGWRPGTYRASYTLLRDGRAVVEAVRDVEIR